jgi:hypothetical protein
VRADFAFLLSTRLHPVARTIDRNYHSPQLPQRRDVSAVVSRLVDGRLQNEGASRKLWMIQNPAK